ncbi:hypothetical protein VTJ49DRAFT_4377 [Mycothermus thermophilus]|uniref:Protein FAF1 n=1 Tax=Humicola insolens TaxID=85995 RepID=A0ABR3VLG8_HUMIN
MPTSLGKRKSRTSEDADGSHESIDAQELLRRHFEAHFKPLAVPGAACAAQKKTSTNANHLDGAHPASDSESGQDDDDSDGGAETGQSDSEWSGVSNDEDDFEGRTVEVVDHSSSSADPTAKMSKQELKEYLPSYSQSSRPPDPNRAAPQRISATNSNKASADADQLEDSAAFLANDLALQRLISESHILSAAGANPSHWQSQHAAGTATNSRPFAAGRTARKTTDMRLQALGAKGSILSQEKMPMAMRKGIVSTAAAREEKRRREARENGIILEREVKKPKTVRKKKGERPVDLPSVGRMRGAELRVSAREARAIAESVRGPAGRKARTRVTSHNLTVI